MSKYFVTGATGFIGGYVARMLLEDGHEVVVLARTPDKAKDLADRGAVVVKGDITDKESMREGMREVDGVFHIAAWYEIGVKNNKAEEINVQGTRNVLELMKELNIPKGVYTSTLAVFSDTGGKVVDESYYFDGKHLSEYDRTKWAAHYQVAVPMMKAGLPLVIVQPGAVYGPDDPSALGDTLRDYLKRRLPVTPKGMALAWGHVEDIARAHILAMQKGKVGETYIIAGPPHTMIEALEIAEEVTGIPAPKLKAPPVMLKAAAGLMGLVEKVVSIPSAGYSAEGLRVSAGATYLGSNAKAKRELGYNPRPLREGFQATLPYEIKRLGIKSRN